MLKTTLLALASHATAFAPGAPGYWPKFSGSREVRLLDGASWKTLDSAALEEDEWIMGTCAAQLKDEAFPSGKIFVNVLAVGTAYQEGEDTGSRGRVLLYSANGPEAEAAEGAATSAFQPLTVFRTPYKLQSFAFLPVKGASGGGRPASTRLLVSQRNNSIGIWECELKLKGSAVRTGGLRDEERDGGRLGLCVFAPASTCGDGSLVTHVSVVCRVWHARGRGARLPGRFFSASGIRG